MTCTVQEYGEAQIEKQYQDAIKSTLADMKMLAESQVSQIMIQGTVQTVERGGKEKKDTM